MLAGQLALAALVLAAVSFLFDDGSIAADMNRGFLALLVSNSSCRGLVPVGAAKAW